MEESRTLSGFPIQIPALGLGERLPRTAAAKWLADNTGGNVTNLQSMGPDA